MEKEFKYGCKQSALQPQVFKKESQENLKKLVLGKQVSIQTTTNSSNDKNEGPVLGKMILDDQDPAILQLGSGFVWHKQSDSSQQRPEERALYVAQGKQAKLEKAGVWSESYKECSGATIKTDVNVRETLGDEKEHKLKVYGTSMT